MNQEVVKQLNHLNVEKAEWKTALKQAELNEEYADEKENIEKEIESINNEIRKLGSELNKE
jgi:phage host-nuclease inhibitor protein Gam